MRLLSGSLSVAPILAFLSACANAHVPLEPYTALKPLHPSSISAGTLFLDDGSTIKVYKPPYDSPTKTIVKGVRSPISLSVAPNGTLFVLNRRKNLARWGTIAAYPPPYTAAPLSIGTGALSIAVDRHDRLIVGARNGGLLVFDPPYTKPGIRVARGFRADLLSIDSGGTLFATDADFKAPNVHVFRPPYTGNPIAVITKELKTYTAFGILNGSAQDSDGNLFLTISGGNNAPSPTLKYAVPYKGKPTVIWSGDDWAIGVAIAAHGTLVELNCALACSALGSPPNNNVQVVAPPYTGKARKLHIKNPQAIAVGPNEQLFVANATTVALFPSPYNVKAAATIASGGTAITLYNW